MIKIIAATVLLFFSNGMNASPVGSEGQVRIYYVPFHMDTYEPITEVSIEKRALFLGVRTKGSEEIKDLYRTISKLSRESFESRMVRLKIIEEGGKYILVDINGNVRSNHLSRYFDSIPDANAFSHLKLKVKVLVEQINNFSRRNIKTGLQGKNTGA